MQHLCVRHEGARRSGPCVLLPRRRRQLQLCRRPRPAGLARTGARRGNLVANTAAFDRGAKFAAYRRLPSLREYLLVDPETRVADLYRRGDDGLWVLHPHLSADTVQLASVDLQLPGDVLWEQVPPEPAPAEVPGAAPEAALVRSRSA